MISTVWLLTCSLGIRGVVLGLEVLSLSSDILCRCVSISFLGFDEEKHEEVEVWTANVLQGHIETE